MRYEVELSDNTARKLLAFSDRELGKFILEGGPAASLVASVRAKPPKPLRIEEPVWGEKVMAGFEGLDVGTSRCTWLRTRPEADGPYICKHGHTAHWDNLIDPQPYREGS